MNTPQEVEAIKHARESLSDVDHLIRIPEFTRFMDRMKLRADQWADEILHQDISPEKREELRLKRLGFLEALKFPAEEIVAHTAVLKGFGLMPGDEVPTA